MKKKITSHLLQGSHKLTREAKNLYTKARKATITTLRKKDQTIDYLRSELKKKEKDLQEKQHELRELGRETTKKTFKHLKKNAIQVEVKTRAAIQFQRWSYYVTFGQMFIGFYLAKRSFVLHDLYLLITVFVILAPLLYGGLYTFNDICDVEFDKHNPKKHKRPLVANTVSMKEAVAFCIVSLVLAFVLASLVYPGLVFFALTFFVLNVLYSFKLKHIPFVDIAGNAITHPLRLYMGYFLAGATTVPAIVFFWFFFAAVLGTLRREKDKLEGREKARPALKYYSLRMFKIIYAVEFTCMALSLFFMSPLELYVSLGMFALCIVILFGYYKIPLIRNIAEIIRF